MTDYPRADRWGRPLIIPKGKKKAEPHTRVTTVAKTLDDMNGLLDWHGCMVAWGAISRPDIAAKFSTRWPWSEETKAELKVIASEMKEAAAGSAGANMGDALHMLVSKVNMGEKVRPLPGQDADIKAYCELMERYGLEVVPGMVERTCVVDDGLLPELIAGSFDFIVRKIDGDGRCWIADLKTQQKIDLAWPSIAMQLSLYSRASSLYRWEDDSHEPMPAVDQRWGLVVHLPAGSGTAALHKVNLEKGWEAVQHALWTRQWRKDKEIAGPAKAG